MSVSPRIIPVAMAAGVFDVIATTEIRKKAINEKSFGRSPFLNSNETLIRHRAETSPKAALSYITCPAPTTTMSVITNDNVEENVLSLLIGTASSSDARQNCKIGRPIFVKASHGSSDARTDRLPRNVYDIQWYPAIDAPVRPGCSPIPKLEVVDAMDSKYPELPVR